MSDIKEDRNVKIIQLFKDGHSVADIAGMVGLSRQRVHTIIHKYYWDNDPDGSVSLTRFQKGRIRQVVFPNIRKFLMDNGITLISFCESINDDSKTSNGVYKFLIGKSKKISIDIINQIMDTTHLSYEKAFCYEELTEQT